MTRWLTVCPEDGFEVHDTEAEARASFDHIVSSHSEAAGLDEGWHHDIETVALYRCERVVGVRLRNTASADDDTEAGEMCRDAEWDFIAELDVVDDKLRTISRAEAIAALQADGRGLTGWPLGRTDSGGRPLHIGDTVESYGTTRRLPAFALHDTVYLRALRTWTLVRTWDGKEVSDVP